jgi:hypothetical protein
VSAATIRPAEDADLAELCRLRLAFIADVRGIDLTEFDASFRDVTRAFFVDTMAAARIRSWLAASGQGRGKISPAG